MVTSASQLPKAKRSLLSLLVTAALAAGAFLLLSEDAPPQGGGVALRLERADEEDRESRALQALADAGALPAHRALRREWFLIEEPDGKRKWRRHRWKWYKQQKEKGVTICRHKRKSKKATCQSNKTPKNQVQDATPPTPPADGGNRDPSCADLCADHNGKGCIFDWTHRSPPECITGLKEDICVANVGSQHVASTLFCGMDPADEANQDARCADVCADQGGKGCIYDYADARDSVCITFPGDPWTCTEMANWGELTGTVTCGIASRAPTFAPTEMPRCDDIDPQCKTVCGYESCCVITDDSSGVGIRDGAAYGGRSRDICLGYPPPADGHTHTWCPNRFHCAPATTTTAATTTVATTTNYKHWCANVTEGCGKYDGIGCIRFPVNNGFDLECYDHSERDCELGVSKYRRRGGALFCDGATGVTKTFGNPFITPTLDESRDWCTDFCGDLSGCLQFPDMSATYRAPFCERQGQIGYCLDTPNSAFTGSVECSGDTQIGSGHVGYNLFLGGGYGKGTSPYYPDNNA